MSDQTCPNCGAAIAALLNSTRMVTCLQCDTTLFLRDDRLEKAGTQGEMHDGPMLLHLGDRITQYGMVYTIVGHARFSYGRGWWDEFWATAEDDVGVWISVDEGDVVFQKATTDDLPENIQSNIKLGDEITFQDMQFAVTEINQAECIALRGEFPELLTVGQTYKFLNLTGPGGRLLSAEMSDGETDWYLGAWLDPFELDVVRAR